MKQSEAFFQGEGEAWLDRNKDRLTGKNDPVLEAIQNYNLDPAVVMEIGCANGWRLDALRDQYDCVVYGCDPGADGEKDNILRRSADKTGVTSGLFDTVIYGWCLYLCDPEDYFKIAMEGDRILADMGFIVVYDFHADHPYKTPYKHKEGLFSHHYDFAKLWLSHPAYHLYGRTIHGETSVTILQKNLETAFPVKK